MPEQENEFYYTNKALHYANKLEALLTRYLNCDFHDFGVKANGNLTDGNWQNPICFALGYHYKSSVESKEVKETINYFLGNELHGQNIKDLTCNYEYYDFKSVDDAYDYIEKTINTLENILFNGFLYFQEEEA